ncbi:MULTISPECIES: DUF6622 family protein [Cysteiniphilum]|uniref:DUF1453 domain-containing protein n=1 Tax=Cysteiniphilum litorale TaxID=2056700 RepID=A0A8J3E9L3_9GAMM|nr:MULTISPECIES: DUF6622 family protein [Cysteiniphilum]WHN66121.1 hypothetical protein NYP54_02515 [Cysteiniphilum sp. QT6929]GGG04480.1 hypothetical protein GCM10010995_22470 [Cysteiniphilum litorale]
MNTTTISFWTMLIYTPWWVYLIFIYCLVIGIKATKPRTVSLTKLSIIPIIFTLLSLDTLISVFPLTLTNIIIWIIAILIGIGIGLIIALNGKYDVIVNNKSIHFHGGWFTFVLLVIIFISKYDVNYKLALEPALADQFTFSLISLSVSGICSGLFVGRLIGYIKRYRQAKQAINSTYN